MILKQIRSTDGTGTLSYLLASGPGAAAVLIDPNREDLQRILYTLQELGLRLTTVIDTHTHADHITAAGELKKLLPIEVVMHEATRDKWKVVDQGDAFGIGDVLRANAAVPVDRYVRDGDIVKVGDLEIRVLHTPGHTDNHITLHVGDNLFTGDLLLIGQAGRSDLPGGNTDAQYESLFRKVVSLPDSTRIYPGHDYEGNEYATLGNERTANPFLHPRTPEEYRRFVADFFPPVADALAGGGATLQCGTKRVESSHEGFSSVQPSELAYLLRTHPELLMVDVREPFELVAFGAIPGVQNIPIRDLASRIDGFPADRSHPIAVVCQSGNRSYEVSHWLTKKGYQRVYNLAGGTSAWKAAGHPVIHPPVAARVQDLPHA